ncbi:MAG: 50S ribosomal protein L21 [Planctomycetota bacterium]
MYAVIETGGKQYRVEPGDVIDVELLPGADEKNDKVEFDRVLMVSGDKGVTVGAPTVDGAKVTGVRLDEVRGPKVVVFKMKRRQGYRRHNGHRQDLHRIRIEKIDA